MKIKVGSHELYGFQEHFVIKEYMDNIKGLHKGVNWSLSSCFLKVVL